MSSVGGGRPVVLVTKRVQLSAAHRLYSPSLSEEANNELYGKCARPNGHGHNYVVKATVKGPVDPVTGMVMNIVDLKKALETSVMKQLDHRHIDKDVPYFQDKVSTTENLAVFIWEQLEVSLGANSGLLFEVSVEETENNTFVYRGEIA